MNARSSYDLHLRAIGQALEARRVQVFELKKKGEQYVVKGEPERSSSLIGRVLGELSERLGLRSAERTWSYFPADIQRLEREGRAKRRRPHRLPDFYSLSNTLRTLGSYLDSKGAELLEIHKRPLSVTILYRTRDGHPNVEERALVSFYGFFTDLHAKREKPPGTAS
ncbi:MAG TPA: hypothetical protein VNN77_04935 [candidate division Zixibacteria bacterium]|nr:hypothetical protein [candidate division Zixibacteria bacterium]